MKISISLKPDKGSGVVIMNKIDYISKMDFILQDNSKFENLGPSSEFDNTAKNESHIQRRLLQLKKEGLFSIQDFTAGFDQLVHNGPECMVCQKSQARCTLTSYIVNDWLSTASISAMAYVSY